MKTHYNFTVHHIILHQLNLVGRHSNLLGLDILIV